MCGIFGIVMSEKPALTNQQLKGYFGRLFSLSESRGKEAAGMAMVADNSITLSKASVTSSLYIKSNSYRSQFVGKKKIDCVVGHSRLATNGSSINNKNNQPVQYGSFTGVHNGIITNAHDLWKEIKRKPQLDVDSEIVMALFDHYYARHGFEGSVQQVFNQIQGAASIAILSTHERKLLLATNTGSLYTVTIPALGLFAFASEKYILQKWCGIQPIAQIKAGTSVIIPYGASESLLQISDVSDYALSGSSHASLLNSLTQLKKHTIDQQKIDRIKRCSRCILPETTPFIAFDHRGVCNYCREHTPFTHLGLDVLQKLVDPYRSQTGQADCLMGFSGGRDSSYGLHFAKKVLGLNPIAYTFDWGMLTDLGRQNASRVTGELGIEHIVVSANIAKKRENIKKNILAWMKKPDLGMVPLFMAGDKESEFHMNQLIKKTGIKLVIYCRGTEYEREEFKSGHCGIKNSDPGGVIHNLALDQKVKMALYYGRQFLANPAYINRSIFDTLSAYRYTYFMPHNYYYLWHYIPWNEKKIISTLRERYGWLSPDDNPATWRIDDASPAFYNYIYYQVQGFTEHDSLRSHQIREGVISRGKALELVNDENKPRYEALKWYFDAIAIDGNRVLSVVDSMRKLY